MRPVIIFVDSKRRTKQLALYFSTNKIPATLINGYVVLFFNRFNSRFFSDMSQDCREKALKEFRLHKIPVLVATDVLSRGIDIKDLDYVSWYTL